MGEQKKKYQCVPAERIAQLMSLGVGYEGYMETDKRDKTFVSACPLREYSLRSKIDVAPSLKKKELLKKGEYRIRYMKNKYIFKNVFVKYILSENVGINGTLFINGYVVIDSYLDELYATIGVVAISPAEKIGEVNYNGIVRLLSGTVLLNEIKLSRPNNSYIIQSGWSLVGQSIIEIPKFADNDIFIELKIGYIYDSGVGKCSSFSETKLKIGEIQ